MTGWPRILLVAIAASLLAGCSDDEPTAPQPCAQLDGECVGVPVEPLCEETACAAGVDCSAVQTVASDAELTAALAGAGAGHCIALAPGSYQGVSVPAGVSLLGRSAADVHIGALSMAAGSRVRGIEVTGTLNVEAAASDVVVDAARISGAGIVVGAGGAIAVSRSELRDSTSQGLQARDAVSVTLDHSIVRGAATGGVWVQCDAGCGCASKPEVAMDHVLFEQNHTAGVVLRSVRARLSSVHLLDTLPGENFARGGGLAATHCSELSYAKLMVRAAPPGKDAETTGYGVLIDSSSANPVGTDLESKGIIIIEGRPGIWLQAIGTSMEEPNQQVVLDGLEVENAHNAAIGFDQGSRGIIIIEGRVSGTHAFQGSAEGWINVGTDMNPNWMLTPVASANLGIGLVWKSASSANIEGLELSASDTHSLLIDGPVGDGSAIGSLTLSGGDQDKGALQQRVGMADAAPSLGAGAPALDRQLEVATPLPVNIEVPAALQ